MAEVSQKSLANLRPAQKGEVRNKLGAGGRKPGLDKVFKKAINEEQQIEIIQAMYNEALTGNVKAAEFIFDRMYGKPSVSVDLSENASITLNQINFGTEIKGKSIPELMQMLTQVANPVEIDQESNEDNTGILE